MITVGALIVRMRKMLGHLAARDRQTVLDAIGWLEELAMQLHRARDKRVVHAIDCDMDEDCTCGAGTRRGGMTIRRGDGVTDGEA